VTRGARRRVAGAEVSAAASGRGHDPPPTHADAPKNDPLHVGEYSVLLMHSSDGRCYSTMEMAESLADAGFRDVADRDTAAARGVMTATK
jgi:hypothetical protein